MLAEVYGWAIPFSFVQIELIGLEPPFSLVQTELIGLEAPFLVVQTELIGLEPPFSLVSLILTETVLCSEFSIPLSLQTPSLLRKKPGKLYLCIRKL
jgi:hypothetical protein